MPTAILVDGGYFIKRYRSLVSPTHPPQEVAKNMHAMCLKHLSHHNKNQKFQAL